MFCARHSENSQKWLSNLLVHCSAYEIRDATRMDSDTAVQMGHRLLATKIARTFTRLYATGGDIHFDFQATAAPCWIDSVFRPAPFLAIMEKWNGGATQYGLPAGTHLPLLCQLIPTALPKILAEKPMVSWQEQRHNIHGSQQIPMEEVG